MYTFWRIDVIYLSIVWDIDLFNIKILLIGI
jgi:hypothetical protein